ncbi:hypothetical protein T265_06016 [Opisthorchis viverrini]|uniref:Uncharacterized protein n=1 Tax=Opisthorchis viverrini TaxID=6198 RepID=A0A074ZHQ3_OPIVI|nr:hypothetical protein T265_06016 [Opisthorchis viverrini]KER26803.1 hypothetical protein T265_06016 [Opisthorchis viverrini]
MIRGAVARKKPGPTPPAHPIEHFAEVYERGSANLTELSNARSNTRRVLLFPHNLSVRCPTCSPRERWTKQLEREFTNRKVHASNLTSASRLSLSRLGKPGSIPALVLPLGSMAARHRKGRTAERLFSTESVHQTCHSKLEKVLPLQILRH